MKKLITILAILATAALTGCADNTNKKQQIADIAEQHWKEEEREGTS